MLSACGINQVILMGRLTADPELRQTPSGVSTCRFTVAINRAFKGQNGEKTADFITVVAWRQTAEFVCRYFSKGKLILVEGELRTSTYDDKKYPDVRHYVTEVYANSVSFGETAGSSGGQGGGYQQAYNNNYNNNNSYDANRNGFGNQGGYPQPDPQQPAYRQPASSVSVGDLSDFEEVISDSDLPF